jgi:hypothetical protein
MTRQQLIDEARKLIEDSHTSFCQLTNVTDRLCAALEEECAGAAGLRTVLEKIAANEGGGASFEEIDGALVTDAGREFCAEMQAQKQRNLHLLKSVNDMGEERATAIRANEMLVRRIELRESELAEARRDSARLESLMQNGLICTIGTNDEGAAVRITYGHRDSVDMLIAAMKPAGS